MVARAGDSVTYWEPKDGKSVTESCERITAETTTLADGKWYYVEGNVEMTHGLALENEAHIILTDDSRLVIRPPSNTPGIAVRYSSLDSDDLYVYGQEKGTGKLEVQGGEYAAGIGDGYFGVGGTVTICGGTVTATAIPPR